MKGPRLSIMTVTMTPTWVVWPVPMPVPAKLKIKKLKVVSDLSPEEEQSMVEWLGAHPIIYNTKLTSYK